MVCACLVGPFGTNSFLLQKELKKATVSFWMEREVTTAAMAPPIKSDESQNVGETPVFVPDIDKLFDRDPYLKPHEKEIRRRYYLLTCFVFQISFQHIYLM